MSSVDYVSALGAGAGIDSKAIVDALVEAERAPQQSSLDRLVSRSETRVSAFGIVKSTLELVRDQFRKLNDVSDLNAFNTQSSDSTLVSATASSSASAGVYQIQVTQLADRDSYTFDGFDSKTDSLNGGSDLEITVTQGGTTTELTVSSPTLSNIVETINDSNLGITANVIDTGAASGRYVLSVSGETGVDNAFSISSAVMTGQAQQTTAQNSNLEVNGVKITNASNSIGTAVAGLNIELKGTFVSESITVTRDTSGVKTEIQNLAQVYNEAQTIFNSLRSGSDAEDELVGALSTDSIFRSVQSSFRNTFSSISSTPSGDINYWADLGVSVQRDGTLKIDEDRLDSALATSFDDVVTALTADTESQSDIGDASRGLAGDMSAMIRDLTKANGPIANAISTSTESLSDYEVRLTELDSRMDRIRERYTQQFAAMQQIVDGFNSTSEYLTNNFAALNNND
ncbi:flagellar filament capping protein FliD [Litoricolaceae bacterium]|nr:flagellar filament capping protein FliD [Litorivicinaceae bacterium]